MCALIQEAFIAHFFQIRASCTFSHVTSGRMNIGIADLRQGLLSKVRLFRSLNFRIKRFFGCWLGRGKVTYQEVILGRICYFLQVLRVIMLKKSFIEVLGSVIRSREVVLGVVDKFAIITLCVLTRGGKLFSVAEIA
jgi:hypothetical protein